MASYNRTQNDPGANVTPEQRRAHQEISHVLYFLDDADLAAYHGYLESDPNMTVEIALILAGGLILLDE